MKNPQTKIEEILEHEVKEAIESYGNSFPPEFIKRLAIKLSQLLADRDREVVEWAEHMTKVYEEELKEGDICGCQKNHFEGGLQTLHFLKSFINKGKE